MKRYVALILYMFAWALAISAITDFSWMDWRYWVICAPIDIVGAWLILSNPNGNKKYMEVKLVEKKDEAHPR